MFLNLKDNQLTVNTYRKPSHYACDLEEMLQAIANCSDESLTCFIEDNDLEDPIIADKLGNI